MQRQFQYVLNLQTTGLKVELEHRIIEVVCLELCDNVQTGNYFTIRLNPEGKFSDANALAEHKIVDSFLTTELYFEDIADELLQFLTNETRSPTLIMHNQRFVMEFLAAEMVRANRKSEWASFMSECDIIDTWSLSKKLHPSHQSLATLASKYNIMPQDRDASIRKADILAQLYPILQSKLVEKLKHKEAGSRALFFSPPYQYASPAAAISHAEALPLDKAGSQIKAPKQN